VEHGLRVTLEYFQTREQQQRALDIVQFKLDVLWTMCDAMMVNYGIGAHQVG
jgi:pyrroloquinoline-quinone synthase